jgi:hypothetical protein
MTEAVNQHSNCYDNVRMTGVGRGQRTGVRFPGRAEISHRVETESGAQYPGCPGVP